ncbi:SusC/RagA family TonB-linked outer membrane protein [Pedobacter cryoconitis]|uniref:TonB-linked SusC/RagA family outer membrane protein n=1 Tax=Pedobacter cryoconitis TaxID=188932 RepID=A0A7X0J6R9_9SPHI|nr:TonB-dependent receptor [Pedobacter cryoconitis]MBB6502153.1 TonB-linked SusC/RagA family outer membrane protein [Pedobacter cryoconitis]
MIKNLRWPIHLLLGLFVAMFAVTSAFAQPGLIKGQILNEADQPIGGINITVKGTTVSTRSGADGSFSIRASAKDILVFSAVSFKTQEIQVSPGQPILVKLLMDMKGLDEVVVIGYGTQRKSNLTSAVSSVSGEKLQQVASSNPINALQGRVAGLTVSSPGGNPGQVADVRLRGIGTFGAHQPLYIIDGVPGDPYFLSNTDIASMEVLKDGAAASIYGSNSANGVILITTKKGKKGAPLIDVSSYYSIVNPTNKYSFLDADGYKKVHTQMYTNAGILPAAFPAYLTQSSTANTDWQKLINRQGISQNYNVGLSGGGDYLTYALSGDLTDDKGTFIGSSFNKKSLKSRNDFTKGILTVGSNIIYSETSTQAAKFDTKDSYFQSPLLPVMDSNEKYGYALTVNGLPKFQNPIAADHFLDGYTKTKYLAGNIRIGLKLYKGLTYTANLNYISSQTEDYAHNPPYRANANDPLVSYPKVYNRISNYKEQLMEHLLNYDIDFGKHSIKAVAGYTAQEKTNRFLSATVDGKTIIRTVVNGKIVETEVPGGFSDPNFNTITAGLGGTFNAAGSNNKYVRLSTLGRISYAYDQKYLLQVSARRDGSSVFGEDRRYGVFPSASVGWNIYKESFMPEWKWLNNLKIRASYGELGNEGGLGFYDHQALITTANTWSGGYVQGSGSTPWPGSASYSLLNRDLRWETIKSRNLGLDFGLFNNQLTGALNYFNNTTDGLLITKEVPPSSGLDNPILNVGKISNKGLELETNYKFSRNDWHFDLGGAFSLLRNKVLSLANQDQVLYGTGLRYGTDHIPTQTRVGKEIGAFYLYEAEGIFQSDAEAANYKNAKGQVLQPNAKAGDIKFKDANGDGVIDESDKTYQGSGFAKYEYSLNLAINYKNFDLSLFWQGVGGNKIYNGNRFELEGMDAGRNFLTTTLNAWTPQNTQTDMPRAVLGDPNRNARESTRFLENGAYLRLKLVQLGYSLPQTLLKRMKINRLRVYLSGQNLITFTKYTGLDPEIGTFSALDTGVDRMMYPQNKRLLAGLQLTF